MPRRFYEKGLLDHSLFLTGRLRFAEGATLGFTPNGWHGTRYGESCRNSLIVPPTVDPSLGLVVYLRSRLQVEMAMGRDSDAASG